MRIRPYTDQDASAVWAILAPAIRSGNVFALPRDMNEAAALDHWCGPGRTNFVAELDGRVVGTSYIRANQAGGGGHVANGGYATAPEAAGRGVARALCEHSLAEARRLGFRAMQFNFVVSTNANAIHLWQSCGFEIVGRLPGAFNHPMLGVVDALVMYRRL